MHVEFGVPVSTAFAYLAHPRNRPEWQTSLRSVELLDDGPPHIGMRWIDHTKPGLSFPLEIVGLDEDRFWAESGGWGPFQAVVTLKFTGTRTGCLVDATVRIAGSGLVRPFGPPLTMAGRFAALSDLRRAARRLESRAEE